jgi:hypothetical protein
MSKLAHALVLGVVLAASNHAERGSPVSLSVAISYDWLTQS